MIALMPVCKRPLCLYVYEMPEAWIIASMTSMYVTRWRDIFGAGVTYIGYMSLQRGFLMAVFYISVAVIAYIRVTFCIWNTLCMKITYQMYSLIPAISNSVTHSLCSFLYCWHFFILWYVTVIHNVFTRLYIYTWIWESMFEIVLEICFCVNSFKKTKNIAPNI